jgi:stage IV sporulation protein A
MNKPFIILLNSANPYSDYTQELAAKLQVKYSSPVLATDCANLNLDDLNSIANSAKMPGI